MVLYVIFSVSCNYFSFCAIRQSTLPKLDSMCLEGTIQKIAMTLVSEPKLANLIAFCVLFETKKYHQSSVQSPDGSP